MRASLFDILTGHFDPGRRLPDVPRPEWTQESILANLNRLFNTRRGSLLHLPEYGLPDITEVYRDMPDSVTLLQQAIKEAIEKYEPRLHRVQVLHDQTDPYAMRLVFLVKARLLNDDPVRFQTTFSSVEAANVAPAVRRE